jgi:hypothetical protein
MSPSKLDHLDASHHASTPPPTAHAKATPSSLSCRHRGDPSTPLHRPHSLLPPIKGAPGHAFKTTIPTSPPQTSSFHLSLTQSSSPEQAEFPVVRLFPANPTLFYTTVCSSRTRRCSDAVLHPCRRSPTTALSPTSLSPPSPSSWAR